MTERCPYPDLLKGREKKTSGQEHMYILYKICIPVCTFMNILNKTFTLKDVILVAVMCLLSEMCCQCGYKAHATPLPSHITDTSLLGWHLPEWNAEQCYDMWIYCLGFWLRLRWMWHLWFPHCRLLAWCRNENRVYVLGFTKAIQNGEERPQFVLCGDVLSNESFKMNKHTNKDISVSGIQRRDFHAITSNHKMSIQCNPKGQTSTSKWTTCFYCHWHFIINVWQHGKDPYRVSVYLSNCK